MRKILPGRLSLVIGTLVLMAAVATPVLAQFDMEFRDTRVDDILRVLAETYDENIAITGSISATTTVNLKGMDIEEALDVLLGGTPYTWRREGDEQQVLRILPKNTPVTEVFALSYTNADGLAQVIAAQVPAVVINAEPHTNSLIVGGPLSAVREVGWLVKSVDRYRAQVSIKAEMVEVTLTESDARGVDISALFSGTDATGRFSSLFSDGTEPTELRVATLQGDVDVSAVLTAIREDRSARLLSSPEITTLDNQAARVHVGERVPYQRATTETATGATLAEVEFIDVGVKLDVTPSVSDGDLLYLTVHSEVSEVLDQSVQNIPRIGTREADTRVLVRHGDTVVIGGLMKDNDVRVTKKVPLLGDIPLLGFFFRRDTIERTKTEFLVFIRPMILADPGDMLPDERARALREPFYDPTKR